MTSYATLGSPGRIAFNPDFTWPNAEPMKDPLVLQLAKKYKKSPAQVFMESFVVGDVFGISFFYKNFIEVENENVQYY